MQDGLTWWTTAPRGELLWTIARGIGILVLGWLLARLARGSIERSAVRAATDLTVAILIGRVVYLGVASLGVITALEVLGIPMSSVFTTLGIVGIAVSLALQDILKNFFAGLYLLFERPFRIGDEIQLKDFVGRVEGVHYRTTTIVTAEGVRIIIPNATLISEVVQNRGARQSQSEPSAPA